MEIADGGSPIKNGGTEIADGGSPIENGGAETADGGSPFDDDIAPIGSHASHSAVAAGTSTGWKDERHGGLQDCGKDHLPFPNQRQTDLVGVCDRLF